MEGNAKAIDNQLTERFSNELDYEKSTLLSYQAAYSLITSNAYSNDRLDGHYQWSVEMINRFDVQAALGL